MFKYTHSPTYRDTQARFYRCQVCACVSEAREGLS